MYIKESKSAQQKMPPLPPASMVIDLRGVYDDVLEVLQIEIEDLASEMKLQNINHWRYLSDFLAFRRLSPLTESEVKDLLLPNQVSSRQIQEAAHKEVSAPQSIADREQEKSKGLTGSLALPDQQIVPSSDSTADHSALLKDTSNDEFQRNIEECIKEVDFLRNTRINALGDIGRTGSFGRNIQDPVVRVIFLTDTLRPDSLSSASAYAIYLKNYYNRLERSNSQLALSTTIVCLNHDARDTLSTNLISRLSWPSETSEWEHIDSLILCEKYREDVGRITEEMQAYIIELLLYTLLIISPLAIRTTPPAAETFSPILTDTGEHRELHPNSYVIGLSAIEHSVRWGRRMLNCGLAEQAVFMMQDPSFVDKGERTEFVAKVWLSNWRELVAKAIPDSLLESAPTMEAFSHSTNAAELDLGAEKATVQDIEKYILSVAQTYTSSMSERREAQRTSARTTPLPTLEDALASTPSILQQVSRRKESSDIAEFRLLEAKIEAQRVLSDPGFFMGAHGAIPRARLQLQKLGEAICDFQVEHEQKFVDLDKKRRELLQISDRGLHNLQIRISSFPLLAGLLHLKNLLAWLTLLLFEILGGTAIIIGLALLHYFTTLAFPGSINALKETIFGIPLYAFIQFTILVIAILLIFRGTKPFILSEVRPALIVEISFWVSLFVLSLLGLSIIPLTKLLPMDLEDITLLMWVFRVPFWEIAIFIMSIMILIIELMYYWTWNNGLIRERTRIFAEVRSHQKTTAQEVAKYITDALALDLLKHAGLTDGKGGPGPYYHRLHKLSDILDRIRYQVERQYRIAVQHLILNSSRLGGKDDATKSCTLHIGEELLDIQALISGYNQLRYNNTQESEEIREFAEILMRVMGEDTPSAIGQYFREKSLVASPESRELHEVQTLMGLLTAEIIRLSISVPLVDMVTPLVEQYRQLDYHIADHSSGLKPLVDMAQSKAKAVMLRRLIDADQIEVETELATKAITYWVQVLWEKKDHLLEETLTQNDVLSKLMEAGYDPQTVKDLLTIRANLLGHTVMSGEIGDLYLLMFPSQQGRRFLQDMRVGSSIIDSPDSERLVLLYIQRHVAAPLSIPMPKQISSLQPHIPEVNGDSDISHNRESLDNVEGEEN